MPGYVQILILCAALAALVLLCARILLRARRLRGHPWPDEAPPEADGRLAERAAESLSQMIRFQTVSHLSPSDRGGYGEWARLRECLRQRYPLTHQHLLCEQIGFSLLYRWAAPEPEPGSEPDREPILLCAHLDVVPADNAGAWTHGPFSGDIEDGYVWGRGALDCKNVLVCVLEAVETLLEEGIVPSRDIFFAFGHDEELGGPDGAGTLAALFAERNAHFEMVLDEGSCLCRSAIPVGRPVAHIGVAEKGMANLRFTARADGGYAAKPPRHTGLGRLSEAVCRLEFRPLPPRLTPLVRDSLTALGPGLPPLWRLFLGNLWLFRRRVLRLLAARSDSNALIRTTVAPTMAKGSDAANVLPDSAEIVLNMRVLHGENDAALTRYLTDLTEDLDVKVEVLSSIDPSRVSRYDNRTFKALSASVGRAFGPAPVVPDLMCGGTDARHYEAFSDCVYRFMPFVLTPGEQERVHGTDERVRIEALGRAVAFYRDLMQTF